MNKKLLICLTLSSILTSLNSSFAKEGFYAGFNANYQILNADAYDPKLSNKRAHTSKYYNTKSLSPDFFTGFDNGENIKIELSTKKNSTTQSTNENVTISNTEVNLVINHKLETSAISLDFRPYSTVNDNFLVYGIFGFTNYVFKLTESGNATFKNIYISGSSTGEINTTAPTIGYGAEFKITKEFFARAQAKYSYINKTFNYEGGQKALKIKGATDLALGVGLYF